MEKTAIYPLLNENACDLNTCPCIVLPSFVPSTEGFVGEDRRDIAWVIDFEAIGCINLLPPKSVNIVAIERLSLCSVIAVQGHDTRPFHLIASGF